MSSTGLVTGGLQAYTYGIMHAFRSDKGRVMDLGTLGEAESQGLAINDNGEVTGLSLIASGIVHAILYGGGKMTVLGTLGDGLNSYGLGINNRGQVVGYCSRDGDTDYHAFLYSAWKMRDLGALLPTGSGWKLKEARGIYATGATIVGTGSLGREEHAFLITLH